VKCLAPKASGPDSASAAKARAMTAAAAVASWMALEVRNWQARQARQASATWTNGSCSSPSVEMETVVLPTLTEGSMAAAAT